MSPGISSVNTLRAVYLCATWLFSRKTTCCSTWTQASQHGGNFTRAL